MRIVASLATMPGREECLQKAIASIAPQVDALVVHFNGSGAVSPRAAMLGTPNNVFAQGSLENRGDQMKFLCGTHHDGDWRLTCDDDLIYPPDYVATLVSWASKLNGPVGAHGSKLLPPFDDYYLSRTSYHFAVPLAEATEVDVLGTGTLCWYDGWYAFSKADFPEPNMADIWAAVAFKRAERSLWVVPHPGDWVKDGNPGSSKSIYLSGRQRDGSFLDTADRQTAAIRQHGDLF